MTSEAAVEEVHVGPNPGPQTDAIRSSADITLVGGAAGGGKSWATLFRFGLHAARYDRYYGAIFLALGRALGETMAVTMVIGNVAQLTTSLLSPGYTMASVIANEWGESRTALYASALVEIGLLLFVMSLLLNIIARLLVWSVTRKTPEQRA